MGKSKRRKTRKSLVQTAPNYLHRLITTGEMPNAPSASSGALDTGIKVVVQPETEWLKMQAQATGAAQTLDNAMPPKTRAAKIKAVQLWDSLDRDSRPPLPDFLLNNFGYDPATGEPHVPASTFHGWRKLRAKP